MKFISPLYQLSMVHMTWKYFFHRHLEHQKCAFDSLSLQSTKIILFSRLQICLCFAHVLLLMSFWSRKVVQIRWSMHKAFWTFFLLNIWNGQWALFHILSSPVFLNLADLRYVDFSSQNLPASKTILLKSNLISLH